MPQVKLGTKDEPSFELIESPDLLAVRTRSKMSLRGRGSVPSMAEAQISDGQMVLAFPEAGVEVYRVPTGKGNKSLADRKAALRREPDVRFAGGVLIDEASKEPVLYTENLFVKFRDDMDPDECRTILQTAGLTIKKAVTYATNAFFVAAPEGTGQRVFDMATTLLDRADVEYSHPELIRKRATKAIYPQQWHLQPTTINGMAINASANVAAAHAVTEGAGITIAIIDDGVDIDHPEFASTGKIVAPRDTTEGSNDPRPKDTFFAENHGTACAGVACADGVLGASGVAPKAKLLPIRLASDLGSMAEAEAFEWAVNNGADVISCSWGPQDGEWFTPSDPLHNRVARLPASTKLALDFAADRGRGGKGCVILFAAGNGNESVDNDGYASYEKVLAVAACNDRGKRSVYSDFGKAVWCSFPSDDSEWPAQGHPAPITPGIWTTDRVGRVGYNPGLPMRGDTAGNFTNSFGGTSSATPGAAGIAALVLAVNPNLSRLEVRDILKRAAEQIDPAGGAYDPTTGHSHLYGFGRLNARTAVDLARPTARNSVVIQRAFDQVLPDLQTVQFDLEVGEAAPVDRIAVHVDVAHTYIGDLVVTLVPPAALGLAAIPLHRNEGGSTRNLQRVYDTASTPALRTLAGKNCGGTWSLTIADTAAQDEGVLRSFGLELFFPGVAPRRLVAAGAAPAAVPAKLRKGKK